MPKRKGAKDKQRSTKHHTENQIEQHELYQTSGVKSSVPKG